MTFAYMLIGLLMASRIGAPDPCESICTDDSGAGDCTIEYCVTNLASPTIYLTHGVACDLCSMGVLHGWNVLCNWTDPEFAVSRLATLNLDVQSPASASPDDQIPR